ncbi:hypothetical protein A4D02_27905 [Niastella koreensis]|uniref:Uncharacterized protein n=1 Tax=Niastella koreensis TaxID=354356 RepID=A0ABX3NYJ1_9BACT|nr:hypothetical protein A4D02_27905 [Niastella koreensis]
MVLLFEFSDIRFILGKGITHKYSLFLTANYIRLRTKLAKEREDALKVLSNLDVESSNLKTYFREGITLSTNSLPVGIPARYPQRRNYKNSCFPKERPIIAKKVYF